MKFVSKNLADTSNKAKEFVAELDNKADIDRALIVGLSGDLGSGKTTFVQAVAKALGVEDAVTSPTFVIQKCYPIKPYGSNKKFSQLVHVDAYRLASGEELMKLDWGETMMNPKNLILIEWPEKVRDVLPSDMKMLAFTFVDENTREIDI